MDVKVQKLESTDGFIAFDFADGPAIGVVRLAPKVLRDGAELFARSTTYACASFGIRAGGGSAGINAKPDAAEAAVAAFVDEVTPLVDSGRWLPGPGVGLTDEMLDALPEAERRRAAFDPIRQAEGAAAAAAAAAGGLDGARVAIVGAGPVADAAAGAVTGAGGTPLAGAELSDACDVILVAGRAGMVDHSSSAEVKARVLVPLTPVPVTARAFALLGRQGCTVVPDFLSTAAPLLDAVDAGAGDGVERVRDAVSGLASEGTGMWLAAVERAEETLRSWQDQLPFGRPLA
jgi:glutamate dehydrogenase/leucine dehydrogenase